MVTVKLCNACGKQIKEHYGSISFYGPKKKRAEDICSECLEKIAYDTNLSINKIRIANFLETTKILEEEKNA